MWYKSTDVSEEHSASIFRIEKQAASRVIDMRTLHLESLLPTPSVLSKPDNEYNILC
jgi:hypothetical protein